MERRAFLMAAACGVVSAAAAVRGRERVADKPARRPKTGRTKVALVRTADRVGGIRRAIELLGTNPVQGKDVLLKPNFNTADQFPGSTHNETLTYLVLQLRSMGAKGITVGERSGPPDTADVLKDKGIPDLCNKLGVGLIDYETLPPGTGCGSSRSGATGGTASRWPGPCSSRPVWSPPAVSRPTASAAYLPFPYRRRGRQAVCGPVAGHPGPGVTIILERAFGRG